ncbi:MAG: carboxypeptidase-like regulatory domain-containing protein [Planctomycetota bacterium]
MARQGHAGPLLLVAGCLGLAVWALRLARADDGSRAATAVARELPRAAGADVRAAGPAVADRRGRRQVLAPVDVQVCDEFGLAVAGTDVFAQCRVADDPGGGVRDGTTDARGVAHLSLPIADFPWLVQANWRQRTHADHGRAAADLSVCDGDAREVVLRLAKLDASLLVRVLDDTGQPVAGSAVDVNFEGRVQDTGPDGCTRFEHMPAGARPIDVRLPPARSDLSVTDAGRRPVTLKHGHSESLTFVAARRGELVVRLAPPSPDATGTCIELHHLGPAGLLSASLDRAGCARFARLAAGEYRVSARLPAVSEWNCLTWDRVRIDAGARVEHSLRLVRSDAHLAGVVVDQDGRRVAGAPVSAFPLAGEYAGAGKKSTWTDANGEFELRGLCAAATAVGVDVTAIETAHFRPLGGSSVPFVEVEAPTAGMVLRLLPGHRLRGKVVGVDGRPLPDCEVSLLRDGESVELRARTRVDRRPPCETDVALEAGGYEFAHLAPGVYELSAADGDLRARQRIEVTGELDVVSAPVLRLEVRP